MTSARYCKRLVPRSFSSHSSQMLFNAWHTCSSVTSGFSPPEPLRLAGGEGHGHQAQHQVTHQRHVTASLEIAEADLALAETEAVLHLVAAEGHPQQPTQRRPGRRIGHEVFLLAGLYVTCPDQPVGAPVQARHPDLGRFDVPTRIRLRLMVQAKMPPRLAAEGRAVPHQMIG